MGRVYGLSGVNAQELVEEGQRCALENVMKILAVAGMNGNPQCAWKAHALVNIFCISVFGKV